MLQKCGKEGETSHQKSMTRQRRNTGKTQNKPISKYFLRKRNGSPENLDMASQDSASNMEVSVVDSSVHTGVPENDPANKVQSTESTNPEEQSGKANGVKDPVSVVSTATATSVEKQSTPDGPNCGATDQQSQAVGGVTPMEKRIMTAIAKLDLKVDKISATAEEMRSEFDTKLRQMGVDLKANNEKLSALETSVNYAHKTVEDQKERVVRVEKESRTLKERLDSSHRMIKGLKDELADFRDAVAENFNESERRSREYSIRLKGVPAASVTPHSDHRVPVASILVKNKLVAQGITEADVKKAMEIAHPLGKPIDGKFNIIARFYARPYRNAVIRAAKQLGDKVEGVDRITEDLTKLDMENKRRAYPQMQAAWEDGQKVQFRKGRLVINGKTVPIDD